MAYISSFEIVNYKSFKKSGQIRFGPGVNVITGQNNAGKTALLQALSLRRLLHPYRSPDTVGCGGESYFDVTLTVSQNELLQFYVGKEFDLPAPPHGQTALGSLWQNAPDSYVKLTHWFLKQKEYHFTVRGGNQLGQFRLCDPQTPTFGGYQTNMGGNFVAVRIGVSQDLQCTHRQFNAPNATNEVGLYFASQFLSKRVFLFDAERPALGECALTPQPGDLASNASNLADLLNSLQSKNAFKFRRYCDTVKSILPQIETIAVHAVPEHKARIHIWNHHPSIEIEELAIPLSDCGTGVGQVLAMVYVAFMKNESSIVLIDEPQSYLHPGAVRKLMEVLRHIGRQHQYIIATHSPTIITAGDPSSIVVVKQQGGESTATSMERWQHHLLGSELAELGVTISDVFGADRILWVEGPTEQQCFPRLLEHARHAFAGTAIIGVKNTGDYEDKKKADTVFSLSNKLSENALLPVSRGYFFDRETRTDEQCEEMRKKSRKAPFEFTRLRMYESYLLHSKAIAEVANADPGFTAHQISETVVENWIQSHINDEGYWPKSAQQKEVKEFHQLWDHFRLKGDAAKLLSDWDLGRQPLSRV